MRTAIVCVALMGGMLFILGLRVSILRGRYRAMFGSPTDELHPLFRAVRAHGNAAEYIPMLAVLILLCSWLAPSWWTQMLSVAAVVVRVTHAVAITRPKTGDRPAPDRLIGALGTYLVGLGLAVTAVATL